jgi:hypothetical protein
VRILQIWCERGNRRDVHVHFNRVEPAGVMRNHKVAPNYVLASHLRHARHMESCLCYDLMIHIPHIPLQTLPRTPPAPLHASTTTMAILQNWLPPSRENWELICTVWAYFPLVRLPRKFPSYAAHMHLLIEMLQVTTAQWVLDWYPQGKTSIESKWNIDGKWGWATMESAGFVVLLYIMYALPRELGIGELPWGNWTLAGCFVSSPEMDGAKLNDCLALLTKLK